MTEIRLLEDWIWTPAQWTRFYQERVPIDLRLMLSRHHLLLLHVCRLASVVADHDGPFCGRMSIDIVLMMMKKLEGRGGGADYSGQKNKKRQQMTRWDGMKIQQVILLFDGMGWSSEDVLLIMRISRDQDDDHSRGQPRKKPSSASSSALLLNCFRSLLVKSGREKCKSS